MTSLPNATGVLASFASELRFHDLPASARVRTKCILLDALASAMAGRGADETVKVIETAQEAYGPGEVTLLSGGTGPLAAAAMVNAYLITAVTVCDIHIPTVCHVSPEVIPPALAIAEDRNATGEDLLAAVAAGLEVTTRVGLGTKYPEFRERGWHSPGVTGPFGSAAAVARLLGLDAGQTTHAFGIALSQAAGTWAQLGTPTIKYQQAHGAISGLLSALLAARSFTANEDAFGATDGGLFSTYAGGGDPDAMLAGLGERWELENISLRPWPAAAYLQGLVTVILATVEEHDLRPESVRRVEVGLSPTAYALHGQMDPKDRFQARLSSRYVAAVVLHDRACWLGQFSAERFADPSLIAFARERVEAIEDRSVIEAGARLRTTLVDGTTIDATAYAPKGDPSDPLPFEEVAAKFRTASEGLHSDATISRTIESVDQLETVPDVGPLMRTLRD